jgi:hypothetical protein
MRVSSYVPVHGYPFHPADTSQFLIEDTEKKDVTSTELIRGYYPYPLIIGAVLMADLNSIPDETRWRIAAEFSATLPSLYDHAFRETAGERYDEIEQHVWMEAAKILFDIAKSLSLPTGTAHDLAETMRMVMVILFGPEFKSEALDVSEDRAVIIIRRCPLLAAGYEAGSSGERMFHKCMAFTLTGIPVLNKDFSGRFVRTMCTGDRQCEIKVAKDEPLVPDKKSRRP